jgi:DNA-binding HxlR family transcriptional regulator
MKPSNLHETEPCRKVSRILSRIGDKWSVLIVMQLGEKPHRFNELRRALGSISQKMLSATLRTLERDGFVSRTVTPTVPPRVDYALTELGRDLLCPVGALGAWAMDNIDRIEAARREYDARLEAERAAA